MIVILVILLIVAYSLVGLWGMIALFGILLVIYLAFQFIFIRIMGNR